MAKSFIHYHNIKGKIYASICTPRRKEGKKDNQSQYLGRVINKETGVFQSRERGIFGYDLEKGFFEISNHPLKEEKLILDFGDTIDWRELHVNCFAFTFATRMCYTKYCKRMGIGSCSGRYSQNGKILYVRCCSTK